MECRYGSQRQLASLCRYLFRLQKWKTPLRRRRSQRPSTTVLKTLSSTLSKLIRLKKRFVIARHTLILLYDTRSTIIRNMQRQLSRKSPRSAMCHPRNFALHPWHTRSSCVHASSPYLIALSPTAHAFAADCSHGRGAAHSAWCCETKHVFRQVVTCTSGNFAQCRLTTVVVTARNRPSPCPSSCMCVCG